jgi:hypothetical protein
MTSVCEQRFIPLDPRYEHFSATLIQHGVFPSAPTRVSVAITTRTLQLFHLLHSHSPATGIQPFVRALCDNHGVSV